MGPWGPRKRHCWCPFCVSVRSLRAKLYLNPVPWPFWLVDFSAVRPAPIETHGSEELMSIDFVAEFLSPIIYLMNWQFHPKDLDGWGWTALLIIIFWQRSFHFLPDCGRTFRNRCFGVFRREPWDAVIRCVPVVMNAAVNRGDVQHIQIQIKVSCITFHYRRPLSSP